MSEDQIVERVAPIVMEALDDWHEDDTITEHRAHYIARRVVQGLGLREERRVCMEHLMTVCDCGRPREVRLVTDWQEDTK